MRDASLDDFLSSSGESEEAEEAAPASEGEVDEVEQDADSEQDAEPESDTDPESDPDSGAEGPPPAAEVEPARSTYAWSPDGATCAACGEQVEERWESEVGLVCVECKAW